MKGLQLCILIYHYQLIEINVIIAVVELPFSSMKIGKQVINQTTYQLQMNSKQKKLRIKHIC
jgi:hypothetical protein